jgi:ABC-2 type transport system permease protein
MLKLIHIAHEEIMVHLREWTFYLTAIGMPLVFAAIGLLPQLRAIARQSPLASVETVFSVSETVTVPTGYVDYAGVITFIPEDQAENLKAFADEATAAQALEEGEIEQYYVIAADYHERGIVTAYSANPQLFSGADDAIRKLLRNNLLQALDDPNLAARLDDPVQFDREGRPPPPLFSFIPADLKPQTLTSAALVIGLFTYIINTGGHLLVRALKREIRARALEVMITSTTPEQFIGGKLLGLSSLALGQAALTLLAGMLVYGWGPNSAGPATLTPLVLALSLPYLLFGYLAYCGGIIGIAAIWPNLPESETLLAMARLLALSPVMGVVFILPNPHSLISVLLTTIPLTAPLLMPFRILLTDIPPWQWGIGLLGLIAWAACLIWLSTRLFRAHTLLTGRSNTLKDLYQAASG